jgi:8-oxo-dGTP pyrophosphatase MutT (NUDIX family)
LQTSQPEQGFLRHVTACNNAELPGRRLAFRIGSDQAGWVLPDIARALAGFTEIETAADGVTLTRPEALLVINRELADRGLVRWRREAFDVRARPDGPVLAQVDRGALPVFGIAAVGVHLNGLVGDIARPEELQLWVARRAADKALDPGKLDHVVAGGVPAGLGTMETLVKEAAEEAAIPAELAAQAREVAVLSYAMERPEGLRRDRLHCFDLMLPDGFTPHPVDGEVSGFELWPLPRVLEAVRDTDGFKFNVNLVLIDLFLRLGLIADGGVLRAELDAAH